MKKKKKVKKMELYNADPKCKHKIVLSMSGGYNCIKCTGWFCL